GSSACSPAPSPPAPPAAAATGAATAAADTPNSSSSAFIRSASSSTEMLLSSSIHSCVVVAMSVLLGGIRRAIGLLLRRHVGLLVIFSRRLCLRLRWVRRSGPGGRLLGCLGLGVRRWSLDIGRGRLGGGGLGLRGGLLGGLRVLRGLGLGLGGGGL